MAIFTAHGGLRRGGGLRLCCAAAGMCALANMLGLPGGEVCPRTAAGQQLQEPAVGEKSGKSAKENEPFESRQPAVMPHGADFAGFCKPGHWMSDVWPGLKATRGDFLGELQTEVVDENQRPLPLVAVPYEVKTRRPAALAKGQPKSLESLIWISLRQDARWANFKLLPAGGGPAAIERSMPLTPMPSYRYFFVVLSQAAGRYDYLDKRVASIDATPSQPDGEPGPRFYEVVSISAARRPSLPASALCWTSIAYLLWDDFDPAQCDVDQQRALIDWLHWGGQILVSGPDALDQLRNSFLGPYLPATVKKSRALSAADLQELSYWAGEVGLPPVAAKPWAGAELIKDPHAEYLPYTGDLLVERKVGRGRIVAPAFRLTGPELTGWSGFDCFFNACLLRRPARVFWIDKQSGASRFWWADSGPNMPRLDAARTTAVRYFARDAGAELTTYAADCVASQVPVAGANADLPAIQGWFTDAVGKIVPGDGRLIFSEDNVSIPCDLDIAPGLGAWNDFSPAAQAARTALVDAAGIFVPSRTLVVWMLLGYLCVLAPVNWIVFRLLGRVEWAWIAAPLIAIACTVVVIHQAQLNVGFARSKNEIAVVEMQPGYARAHVTRYTALYSSLATDYELRLDDPAGQILPFPRVSSPKQFQMAVWQTPGELVCRRGDGTQLSGLSVGSNLVDFVHSEAMADFGGAVALHRDNGGELRATNGTSHPLDDCRIVRGNSPGADLASIGRLEPGETKLLAFSPWKKIAAEHRREVPATSGELSVQRIADVALQRQELRCGEICLVARIADDVPGLSVAPAARQARQAVLLVAHLDPGRLPEPQADKKYASAVSYEKARDRHGEN